MNAFTLSFLFVMCFTLAIGIFAVIFVSFDEEANPDPRPVTNPPLYEHIRHVNTNTIETVDPAGQIQRWTRSS